MPSATHISLQLTSRHAFLGISKDAKHQIFHSHFPPIQRITESVLYLAACLGLTLADGLSSCDIFLEAMCYGRGGKMDFEVRLARFPLPLPLVHMSPKFYFTSVNLGVFSGTMNLLFIVLLLLAVLQLSCSVLNNAPSQGIYIRIP